MSDAAAQFRNRATKLAAAEDRPAPEFGESEEENSPVVEPEPTAPVETVEKKKPAKKTVAKKAAAKKTVAKKAAAKKTAKKR